jgi:uncharacterized protein YjeT (DUF2065 family)
MSIIEESSSHGSRFQDPENDSMGQRPRERLALAWLFLLAPLVCCLGPVVVGALAVASAATLGTVGGVLGAVVIGVVVFWMLRHRRCATAACKQGPTRVA